MPAQHFGQRMNPYGIPLSPLYAETTLPPIESVGNQLEWTLNPNSDLQQFQSSTLALNEQYYPPNVLTSESKAISEIISILEVCHHSLFAIGD